MKKAMMKGLAAAVMLATTAMTTPAMAATDEAPAHDLTFGYTVSDAKAAGYAGAVAIYAKNVGTQRYYGEFPAVSFRVDVKTAGGPEGVDRLITPGHFNGAYTRDLGFNEETSTRSFMVTLSNPVNVGEDQLVASLNFGDGLTKEGRLTNYVTVTQVGRVDGDETHTNDRGIDSRRATMNDTGKAAASGGIF